MAAAQFAMGSRPAVKTEQFDMESFFDFNQGTTQPSPATASSSRSPKNTQQDWNAVSPFDQTEERQQFNGPSHDYNQYKQQVGLPVGSMQNMPMNTHPAMFDGYNSGIDMNMDGGFGAGWSSGIDMDAEMSMDFNQPAMPAMFFPPGNENPSDSFVNPNTIAGQEEPPSNVGRLWPGMHSQQAQQAAMAKAAQAQAVQQRQLKLQAQQQQYRQAANASQGQSQGNGKRPSHVTEPHVEESISRLLNQMRQNSTVSDDAGSPGNVLPHIARMRKDEEEMDEDERLLASEEGKKLSSKERRQLRNKVSARAFRSRRKEYIGQLEGEVALKSQEANTMRSENTALLQENERYRGLIETLLRHPAFTPFINELSNDPSSLGMLQQHTAAQPNPAPQQPQPQQQQPQPTQPAAPREDSKPEFLNFDASQLHVPTQQAPAQQQPQQQERVGLAMIPENDFSKLNLNSFQQSMNYPSFQSVNAFAVTDLPAGPDPVDLLIESPIRLPSASAASSDSTSDSATASASTSGLTVLLAKLDSSARRLDYSGRPPL